VGIWQCCTAEIFVYAVFIWLISAFSIFAATPLTKIVVGYAAMNGRVSPLWIADEQGFLAKYGLQPTKFIYAARRYSLPVWHPGTFNSAAAAAARRWRPWARAMICRDLF
jgi:hypothetical protein